MARKKKQSKLVPTKYREKLRILVRRSPQFKIVQGDHYLYFSVQPAQEEISTWEILKTTKIACYSLTNSKQAVLGYFVVFTGKPKMSLSEFGAAIFYSQQNQYKKMRDLYTDQKLRVEAFDDRDYFVSVKWKSASQEE